MIEQVDNVCKTSIIRDAWERGQGVTVHGWIYGLRDGLLRDLGCTASGVQGAAESYRAAVAALNAQ